MRPLVSRYVPGSTYKTMTLLAALDSGRATLADPFDQRAALGPVVIGTETFGPVGNNIEGYTHRFPIDLDYAYVHSDNIIFAEEGAKLGAGAWLDYNRRFYVGAAVPFDLPVAPSLVTRGSGQLAENALAENAFGQGVDFITPLELSLINATIAAGGQLMRPHLVQKIVATDGMLAQSSPPQSLGSPITSSTAARVRDAMYGATRCGSGAAIPDLLNSPWAIMIKTGTGEVGGGKPAHAWLMAQAPYPSPTLTIVAMKEHGGEGGFTLGPLVADLFNAIFSNPLVREWKPAMPVAPDPAYCQRTGLTQP
jgi:cell division protein FtsI/penicillin-binding protein 2